MKDTPKTPVLELTRYDRVSSWLLAVAVALAIACVSLSVVWATNRVSDRVDAVPIELIEFAGGTEDGAIDETLRLDSPEALAPDASLAEIEAEESEIVEVLENVVELADLASEQLEQQYELDAQNAGRVGSAEGTGRRALGMGPGDSGLPREQRWFVRFPEQSTIEEYARQLDHFGIELGALLPDGTLTMLSRFSDAAPRRRSVNTGKGESRLFMTWQGGERRRADRQLFERAGIPLPASAVIFHFYPPETEEQLARLEFEFRKRPPQQVRRTYFLVTSGRGGYEFNVTNQTYF